MSIKELQEQVDNLLEEMEGVQEVCDTLEICSQDDGCVTCKTNEKIKALEQKIEELENKVEELTGEEEEEE